MTLKEALKADYFYTYRPNPNLLEININKMPNTAQLIERAFKRGYEVSYDPDEFEKVWQEHKAEFLGE